MILMLQEIKSLLEDIEPKDRLGIKFLVFANYVYNVRGDQLRALL